MQLPSDSLLWAVKGMHLHSVRLTPEPLSVALKVTVMLVLRVAEGNAMSLMTGGVLSMMKDA